MGNSFDLELCSRGEKTRPVHLQAVTFPAEPKLHSEKVAGDELGDLLLAGPEGGEADLLSSVNMDKVLEAGYKTHLAELREAGICKQRHVAQQLVAAVLGTIHV